jgi:phospholipid-binding lipoprotein MlaA
MRQRWTFAAVVALSLAAATAPAAAQSTAPEPGSLDEFNVWADGINQNLNAYILAPAIKTWNSLPAPLPAIGRNMFENLNEPVTTLSKAMSSDASGAMTSAVRFALNTTVGLLGALDVANAVGLPPQPASFGEGVCKAQIPLGPYVVVPLVGGATVGVAGAGLLAYTAAGLALGLVSMEFAFAGTAVNAVATSAALENLSESDGPLAARKTTYVNHMTAQGCRTS